MQTEYEFRIWNKITGEWLNSHDFAITATGKLIYNHDHYDWTEYLEEERYDIVIQKYTGLTDKNDVKIYEGDICKVENQDFLEEFYITNNPLNTRVRQHNKEIVNRYPCVDANQYEIIGNIFENPELLTNDSN